MRKRLRVEPVGVFPWLFAAALVWYALPRGGFFPAPGTVIKAHYPAMVKHGLAILATYWFCAAVLLLGRAARRPPGSRGRLVQALLGLPLVGFAIGYGLSNLHVVAVPCVYMIITWLWAVLLAAQYHGRDGMLSPLTSLALSLFVILPLGFVAIPAVWPSARDVSQLRTPDGRIYHVQRKSQMQATTNILTEEVSRGPLFLRTRVIGVGSDESGTYLVRPLGQKAYGPFDPHGQLVLSQDSRFLLLVRSPYGQPNGCLVYLAYDIRDHRFYGLQSLEGLSPFTLIGPNDTPDPDDVSRFRESLHRWESYRSLQSLRAGRTHPNPHVRALVAELLAERPPP